MAGTRRLVVVGAEGVGRGDDVEKEEAADEDAPVPLMADDSDVMRQAGVWDQKSGCLQLMLLLMLMGLSVFR